MRIIESDVSGVWGPEIKAVASQARATHTHTRTHKKMRKPCRPSEAAAWLIKETWHPYTSLTSRCRASGSGSQASGTLTKAVWPWDTNIPLPPPILHHNPTPPGGGRGGGRQKESGGLWARDVRLFNQHQQLTSEMQRIYYPSFQFSNETSLNIRHYMKHRLCFIWSADQCRLAAFMSHSIAVPGLLLYTKR